MLIFLVFDIFFRNCYVLNICLGLMPCVFLVNMCHCVNDWDVWVWMQKKLSTKEIHIYPVYRLLLLNMYFDVSFQL